MTWKEAKKWRYRGSVAVQVDDGCWIIDSITELVGGLLEPVALSMPFAHLLKVSFSKQMADGRWQVPNGTW